MAYGLRATVIDAVRSVLQQSVPAEVVVVHSGPGDLPTLLSAHGLDVRIVRSDQPLRPGGTRNLGIASTSAPYVAFLADDCVATPGWVEARIAEHACGTQSVASALDCHAPSRPVALAAHLCLFVNRMPRTPADRALRYGASYARELFGRHGLFRDDLESGEDTEFHQRLPEADRPRWHPAVVTLHQGPEHVRPFLSAQYQRGYRMALAWEAISQLKATAVASNVLSRTSRTISSSFDVVDDAHRAPLLLAVPLIVIGNVFYALGALSRTLRT